jgi:hypothetical protein
VQICGKRRPKFLRTKMSLVVRHYLLFLTNEANAWACPGRDISKLHAVDMKFLCRVLRNKDRQNLKPAYYITSESTKNTARNVGSEVFMAVKIHILVFWIMTLCLRLEDGNPTFQKNILLPSSRLK